MKIKYQREVHAIGRNGMMKQVGLDIFRFDLGDNYVELRPLNTQGLGHGSVQIPLEDLPRVIAELQGQLGRYCFEEWVCTDPDAHQYVRWLGGRKFEVREWDHSYCPGGAGATEAFREANQDNPTFWSHLTVDLDELLNGEAARADLERIIDGYGLEDDLYGLLRKGLEGCALIAEYFYEATTTNYRHEAS